MNTTGAQTVPEISPADFLKAVESGESLQVVDVRSPARVAAGRIHVVSPGRFHNIPGSILLQAASLAESGIDPSLRVVVVCGHGNDSRLCANVLNGLGARAQSLSGGMAAWMNLCIPRTLHSPGGIDRLVQFDRVGKGSLGYLLVSRGEALLIDPPRDPAPYIDLVQECGARLVAVADTHVHADYVSGAPALARDLNIPYYLHPADNAYPYDDAPGRLKIRPVHDGTNIRLGAAAIVVVHTPGHSPGSVTYRVGDDAAFTGDFLFVGSVGRPDIADRTREWSALLWKSVERARNEWPLGLVIYPAHYGSEAERGPGGAVCAPFGTLPGRNPSLRIAVEKEFLDLVMKTGPAVPPAYRTIKGINIGLFSAGERECDELESGKNECALPAP